MSHLDGSAYQQQKFSASNRTNFLIERNPEVSIDFTPLQQHLRGELRFVGERNMKLKEDYSSNKAKLMAVGGLGQGPKRVSSMEMNQNNQQWFMSQQKHQIQQRTNQVISPRPPQSIPPQPIPAQQNLPHLSNLITQQSNLQLQSYIQQIHQLTQQISTLLKSQKSYQKQVQTYKQKLNKIQSILHQKQTMIINQRTQILSQKESISQLQRHMIELKSVSRVDQEKGMCGSCEELTRKIAYLTKQITELTTQLNNRSEKIQRLQSKQKQYISFQSKYSALESRYSTLETQNSSLQRQLEQVSEQYENRIRQYESEMLQLRQNGAVSETQREMDRMAEEMRYLREQNKRLEEQFEASGAMAQHQLTQLTQQNQYLSQQLQRLRTITQQRNDGSMHSSQQQSTLIQYQKSIQLLQQQIIILRQQLQDNQKKDFEKVRRLEQQLEMKEQEGKELTSMKLSLNETRVIISEREDEVREIGEKLQESNRERVELMGEVERVRREVVEVQGRMRVEIENRVRRQVDSQYRLKISEIQQQLIRSQQQYQSLLTNYNQLLQHQHSTTTQPHHTTQQTQTLNNKINTLQQQNLSLTSQLHILRSQLHKSHLQLKQLHTQQSNTPAEFIHKTENQYVEEINAVRHELRCSKKMIAELFAKIEEDNREIQKEEEFEERERDRYDGVIRGMNVERERLSKEVDRLNQQIVKLNQQIVRLQSQLLTATTQLQTVTTQLQTTQTKLSQTYQNLVHAQQYIQTQQKHVFELQNQVNIRDVPQSNQTQLHNIISSQKLHIQELEQEIAKLINGRGVLSSQIERMTEVIKGLENRNRELVAEGNQLRELVEASRVKQTVEIELNDRIESLTKQNAKLTKQLQQASTGSQQKRHLQITTQQLTQSNSALNLHITHLQQQLSNHQQTINQFTQSTTLLQSRISQLQSVNFQLLSENKQLQQQQHSVTSRQEYESLHRQFTELQQKLGKQNQVNEMEIYALKGRLGEMAAELEQLRALVTEKQYQLNQLKQTKVEITNYLSQSQSQQPSPDLLQQLKNYQKLIQQLQQQKQQLFTHLSNAQTYIFEFQQKNYTQIITQLELTINNLHEEKQRLEQRQRDLEYQLHQGRGNQQEEDGTGKQERERYLGEISALQKRIIVLEGQINRLQGVIQQMQAKVALLSQENARMHFMDTKHKDEVNDLISQIKQLKDKPSQHYQQLQTQLTNLHRTNLTLTTTINQLQQDNFQHQSTIQHLHSTNQHLQSQITNLTSTNTRLQSQTNKLQTSNSLLHETILRLQQRNSELQGQKESVFREVEKLRSTLVNDQVRDVRQVDESRVRVDEFVVENRRIMDRLRQAESYIQGLELKCEEYLRQIQSLKSGQWSSMAQSRRSPNNHLDDNILRTPINSLQLQPTPQQYITRITQLQQLLHTTTTQLHHKDQQLQTKQTRINTLSVQLSGLSQNIIRQQKSLALKQHEHTRELNIKQVRINTLSVQLSGLSQNIIRQQQVIAFKEHEHTRQMSIKQVRINTLSVQLSGLSENVLRLQQLIKDKDKQHQRQLKNKQMRISTLSVQLSGLSENVIRLQKVVRDNEQKLVKDNGQQQIKTKDTRINTLLVQLSGLSENVIRLQKALVEKEQQRIRQIQAKDTRINTLLVQLSGLSENVIRLQKTIKDKEDQERFKPTGTFEVDKTEFERLIVKLEHEKAVLRQENERLNELVKVKSRQLEVVEGKSRDILHNLETVQRENVSNGEISELRKKISQKESQLAEVISHLNDAQQFIANNQAVFIKAEEDRQLLSTQVIQKDLAIKQLQSTISSLSNTIKQLTQINPNPTKQPHPTPNPSTQQLTQANTRLKLQLSTWQSQVASLNQRMGQLRKVEIQYNELLADLDQKNKDIEANRLRQEQVIQGLREQNAKVVQAREVIVEEKRFLEDTIAKLNQLIEKDRKRILELNGTIEAYKTDLIGLGHQHEQLIQQHQELIQVYQQSRLSSSQPSAQQSQSKLTHLQHQLNQAQSHITALQTKLTTTTQLQTQLKATQLHITNIQTRLQQTQTQKEFVQNKLKEAQQFITYLQQQRQKGEYSTAMSTTIPQQEKQQLVNRLIQAQSYIAQMQKDKAGLLPVIQQLTKDNETLMAQNNLLSQTNQQKDIQLHEQSNKHLRIQQQLQQTVIRVSQQHIHLSDTITQLQRQLKDKVTNIDNQQQQRRTNQVNTRVLQQMSATITRINKQNQILLQQSSQLQDIKQNQLPLLKQQLQAKKQQLSVTEKQLEQSIGAKEQVEHLKKQLEQTTSRLVDAESEAHHYRGEYDGLGQQCSRLTNQLAVSQQQLQHLRLQNLTLSQKTPQSTIPPNQMAKLSQSLTQITLSLKQKSQLISSLQASLRNQRNKSLQVQKGRTFFQTKLLQAEEYIAQTQKDKKQLSSKYEQLNKQLQRLRLHRIQEADEEPSNGDISGLSQINDRNEKSQVRNQDQKRQLVETVENQEVMIRELTQNLNDLQQLLDTKLDELNALNQENISLKSQLNPINQPKKQQQPSDNLPQQDTSTVLDQNGELKPTPDTLNTKMKSFRKNIDQLHDIIGNLEKQLNDQRQQKDQLRTQFTQLQQLQQNITELSNELISVNGELVGALREIEQLKARIQQLVGKIGELQSKIVDSQHNLQQSQIKVIDQEKKISQLQRQKQQMQANSSQAFTRQLQAHKSLNQQLVKQRDDNLAQLNLLRQKVLETVQMKHHLHQLQRQVCKRTQLQGKVKQAQEYIKYLEEKQQQALLDGEIRKEQHQGQLARVTDQLEGCNKVIEDMTRQIEELVKIRQEMTVRIQDLTVANEEVLEEKRVIADQAVGIEELERVVDTKSRELEEKEKRLVQAVSERDELELKHKTLIQQLNSTILTQQIKHLQLSKQLQSTTQQLTSTQAQLNNTQQHLTQLNNKLTSLTTQNQYLNQQLTLKQNQLADTNIQLQQAKVQELEKRNQFNQLAANLQLMSDEKTTLIGKVEELSKEIVDNSAKQREMQGSYEVQVEQLAKQIASLQHQKDNIQYLLQKQTTQTITLQTQLQSTNKQLTLTLTSLTHNQQTITQLQQVIESSKQLANVSKIYQQQAKNNSKKIEQLTSQVNESAKELVDMEVRLGEAMAKCTETEGKLDQANRLLTDTTTKLTQTQTKLNQSISHTKQLNLLNQHLMQQISDAHILQDQTNQKLLEANTRYNQSQQLLDQAGQQLVKNNQLMEQANVRFNGKVEQLEQVRLQLAELKKHTLQQLTQLEQEIQTMKEDNALLKSKLLQAQKYIMTLQTRLSSIDQLQKSHEEKSSLLSSQQLQLSHLSTDLKDLSNKLTVKQQQLLTSQTQLLGIKHKLSQLQQKIQQEQRQKTTLRQKLDQSLQNSHQLTVLNDRLKLSQQQLLSVKVTNKDLQNQLSEVTAANLMLNQQVQDLTQRNNQLLTNLQKLNTQFTLLEQQNTELKEQLQEKQLRLMNLIEEQKQQAKEREILEINEIEELKLKQLEKEQEIQQLKETIAQLKSKAEEQETDFENYKRLTEENSKELVQEELREMARLQQNLKSASDYITTLQSKLQQLNTLNQSLVNDRNSLELSLNQANSKIDELTTANNALTTASKDLINVQTITKLVQKLTKFVQQNDSLGFYLEENIERDLLSNPIFKSLYETVKYKFKLLNAIDNEKTLRLQEKQREIQEVKKELTDKQANAKKVQERLSQAEIVETSYHEVLHKLIEMERLNVSLQQEVNLLNNQLSLHKSQIEEFQSKLQNQSSSLSEGDRADINAPELLIDEKLKEQNLRLRKELEQAQYQLHKLGNNIESFGNSPMTSPINNKKMLQQNNEIFQGFLQDCLATIGGLEESVAGIEKDMVINKESIERLLTNKQAEKPALGSKRSEDSWMLQKIQQLEEKLLQNELKMKQHKQKTSIQLINMVKDSIVDPLSQQTPSTQPLDHEKIQAYLRQLQQMIVRKDIQHDEQILALKTELQRIRAQSSISPSKGPQEGMNFDVEQLLKEIQGLNNHIQIYHDQAARRKIKYKKTIEQLLRQVEQLRKQYQTVKPQQPISGIMDQFISRTKNILEHQNSFDDMSGSLYDDDYIVLNNEIKYLPKKNASEQQFAHGFGSIAQDLQNRQSSSLQERRQSQAVSKEPQGVENRILNLSNNNISKEEILSKPILEFIVQNRDFDENEVDLLKKKIADIQVRSNQEKARILQQHQGEIVELLQKNRLLPADLKQTQLQSALSSLANNLRKEQVQRLSSPQQYLSEDLLAKLQQILQSGQNSSFLKSQTNSYEMMQAILEIKSKYYPEPTPLSQQMYHHLIKLLSSKDDQEFYALVDSLFAYLSALENDFLITLKQKEEIYQKHTEKMNEVLGLNDQSEEDLDEEDEEYYKRVLLLGRQEASEIQKIRRESTEKGISEQLQKEIQNAGDQPQ